MSRRHVDAAILALSGLLFVGFPVVRPFGDGSGDPKVVAETFASNAWVVAHVLGLLAFIFLALGMHGLMPFARNRNAGYVGFVLSTIGAGLTVAFFGAEAFGLHSIGQQALREGRTDALELANDLRFGPAIFIMLAGLLSVVTGTCVMAFALWESPLPRWAVAALALGVFLWAVVLGVASPNQPIRIAESLLLAAALWTLAWKIRHLPPSSSTGPAA